MRINPHSKDLRKGRFSESEARYFITFNTDSPSISLATPLYFDSLQNIILEMEAEKQVSDSSFIVMPDHIHFLFRLGRSLSLSQAIGKIKQQSRKGSQLSPINWQDGFYDHKIRKEEEVHPILHYMYTNPYRAGLLAPDRVWPFVHITKCDWLWLQPLLKRNCPYPEWLAF